MKRSIICLILMMLSIFSIVFAQQGPMIQNNVHVLQNATPSTCQAAASGRAGPADMVGYSGGGEFSGTTGPGVRSCTGCAVDNNSGDCVCKICYYYFN